MIMMIYHHTRFSSEGIVKPGKYVGYISLHCDLELEVMKIATFFFFLFPFLSFFVLFFAWHFGPWWQTTILSLVTKGWAIQKISSGQRQTQNLEWNPCKDHFSYMYKKLQCHCHCLVPTHTHKNHKKISKMQVKRLYQRKWMPRNSQHSPYQYQILIFMLGRHKERFSAFELLRQPTKCLSITLMPYLSWTFTHFKWG